MKRIKTLLFFVAICILMTLLAVSASAKGLTELYIDGYSETEDVEKIYWSKKNNDGKNYLYIPTSADKDNLAVYFSGAEEITVGGVTVKNGEKTNVFASEGTYTIVAGGVSTTLNVKHTGQPAVMITTESGSLSNVHANKNYKEPGSMIIANAKDTQYNGALEYIKGRGNSSWAYEKKPYNIKLDSKTNLFKMGKSKKWCLLANYYDKAFSRNVIAYNLADKIGLDYTSKQTPVCLFVNGEYLGLYSLCEKVEIGSSTIDINDLEGATEKVNTAGLDTYSRGGDFGSTKSDTYKYVNIPNNPDDITGGYLLEIDLEKRYALEISGFVTSRGIPVVIKEPEYASKAQVEYIRDYFQAFEDAIFSETGYNKLGKHYSEYCDMDSLVKTYIVNDFCVNLDSGITSCYFYKDSGEANMFAGPIWDFDMSLANGVTRNGYNLKDPTTTFVRDGVMYDNISCDTYYNALYDHADFEKEVLGQWKANAKPILPEIYALAKNYKAQVKGDAINDYILWNRYSTTSETTLNKKFDEETKIVTDFMTAREKFLDGYYPVDHSAIPSDSNASVSGFFANILKLIRDFFNSIRNFFANLFK